MGQGALSKPAVVQWWLSLNSSNKCDAVMDGRENTAQDDGPSSDTPEWQPQKTHRGTNYNWQKQKVQKACIQIAQVAVFAFEVIRKQGHIQPLSKSTFFVYLENEPEHPIQPIPICKRPEHFRDDEPISRGNVRSTIMRAQGA